MHRDSCSVQAVRRQPYLNCPKVFVNLNSSFIQNIYETSQYIFYFPHVEILEFDCPSYSEQKQLKGVYLYYNRNCNLKFQNQTLPTSLNTTSEMLISDFSLTIDNATGKILPFNVSLNHLQMELSLEYYSAHPVPISSSVFEGKTHFYT